VVRRAAAAAATALPVQRRTQIACAPAAAASIEPLDDVSRA
jgi:hypothetical protein